MRCGVELRIKTSMTKVTTEPKDRRQTSTLITSEIKIIVILIKGKLA
jgi:hypothetical protein